MDSPRSCLVRLWSCAEVRTQTVRLQRAAGGILQYPQQSAVQWAQNSRCQDPPTTELSSPSMRLAPSPTDSDQAFVLAWNIDTCDRQSQHIQLCCFGRRHQDHRWYLLSIGHVDSWDLLMFIINILYTLKRNMSYIIGKQSVSPDTCMLRLRELFGRAEIRRDPRKRKFV